MKKIYTILPLVAAAASAAYAQSALSLIGGGTTLEATDISGTYSQIFIEDGSPAYSGSSATGLTKVESTLNTAFWPGSTDSFICATESYEFNTAVLLENTLTSSAMHYESIYVGNGATLKFNNGLTVATPSATNNRFIIGSQINSTTYASQVFGNIEITSTTGNIVDSSSGYKSSEFILGTTNLVVNAGPGISKVDIGKYTHLYYGSTLTLNTDVSMNTLAPRSACKDSDIIGVVNLNGNTLSINTIVFNPDSINNTGNLYVDFGESASDFVVISTASPMSINNPKVTYADLGLVITNFKFGEDHLLFRTALTDEQLSILSINGHTSEEIVSEIYNYKGTDYYSYYVAAIPEPSTYAAVLGALVLGFALYRRRR